MSFDNTKSDLIDDKLYDRIVAALENNPDHNQKAAIDLLVGDFRDEPAVLAVRTGQVVWQLCKDDREYLGYEILAGLTAWGDVD